MAAHVVTQYISPSYVYSAACRLTFALNLPNLTVVPSSAFFCPLFSAGSFSAWSLVESKFSPFAKDTLTKLCHFVQVRLLRRALPLFRQHVCHVGFQALFSLTGPSLFLPLALLRSAYCAITPLVYNF